MNLAEKLKATATAYKVDEDERNYTNILAMCSNSADKGGTEYYQDCWTVHWQTVTALEDAGFMVTLQSWMAADATYTTGDLESVSIASGDSAMLVVSWA